MNFRRNLVVFNDDFSKTHKFLTSEATKKNIENKKLKSQIILHIINRLKCTIVNGTRSSLDYKVS